jgi:hypothetical protein
MLPSTAVGAPKPYQVKNAAGAPILDASGNPVYDNATYPWLAWNNRPFASAEEILQVPTASSAKMLAQFSTINPNLPPNLQPNPYGTGTAFGTPTAPGNPIDRQRTMEAPFGHLLNVFASAPFAAAAYPPAGNPPATQASGAPNFGRILEYIHVPSRFVGTDTVLRPEVFNNTAPGDIASPGDPRYLFQPPFNKVSRRREPGQVNLNTVTGRRIPPDPVTGSPPFIWSPVFDGIMHRDKDGPFAGQGSHFGPAWRDVILSRRGYVQQDASGTSVDKPAQGVPPDTLTLGLNPNFPTFVANPFRSHDASELVPLKQMWHSGANVSWLRRHHYTPGPNGVWGAPQTDDDNFSPNLGLVDDIREAGFNDDMLTPGVDQQLPAATDELRTPLFSETFSTVPSLDAQRNPAMRYQPMSRMANLVTNRSNVFAVWITVGYFEVERAPDWNDPDTAKRVAIRARFGGTMNDADASTIAGFALYNRVYPDGYMLGRELGSDTGDTQRHRGFYIIDRTAEVGFKPGEDLNVEKAILLRRRIE